MNEMEALRIDEELQKQKFTPNHHTMNRHSDETMAGMVDLELLSPSGDPGVNRLSAPEVGGIKKTTLSNSLIDLTDGKYTFLDSIELMFNMVITSSCS